MCGIAGYIGGRPAVAVVVDQLRRLEYRGYDSAGVAAVRDTVQIVKSAGKLRVLEALLAGPQHQELEHARSAIAHTRWATHGGPSTANAHPHADGPGRIVVCHNGIIENHAELRRGLEARGHVFSSETDTEVLPHLIRELYQGDLEAAVRLVLPLVRGSYALTVVSADEPDLILAARQDSPLVVGLAQGEAFLASDIPALLPYTRRVLILEDGELAVIRRDSVRLTRLDGALVERAPVEITWDVEAAEKGGYPHFMLKEIHEQPTTLRATLRGRVRDGRVELPEVGLDAAGARSLQRIYLVGCGTAYHAGLAAAQTWERRFRTPVLADLASEFRYRDPVLDAQTLVVLISQSGETADTLAAMRLASAAGARTLAVVNVVGSTLAREADAALYTQAGPEIGVASTKAYTSQLVALSLLGLHLGRLRGSLSAAAEREQVVGLERLPDQAAGILAREAEVEALARELLGCHDFFFVGRGLDYAVAQEGALKLKEISYRHSEALAAGEMKHGTLALVTEEVVAVAIATQTPLRTKLAGNLREVTARGARLLAILRESDAETAEDCRWAFRVPDTEDALMPVLAILPLQLLAYHVARLSDCEIDQPRNLAKSVTVE